MEKITGTIQYQDISTGFWGVIDEQGRKWRPICLSEDRKVNGKKVKMKIKPLQVEASIFMWGEPMEVVEVEH